MPHRGILLDIPHQLDGSDGRGIGLEVGECRGSHVGCVTASPSGDLYQFRDRGWSDAPQRRCGAPGDILILRAPPAGLQGPAWPPLPPGRYFRSVLQRRALRAPAVSGPRSATEPRPHRDLPAPRRHVCVLFHCRHGGVHEIGSFGRPCAPRRQQQVTGYLDQHREHGLHDLKIVICSDSSQRDSASQTP